MNSENIDESELQNVFRELLVPGDSVLVHASMKAIGWFADGPEQIIRSLLDALGPQGTLVMPTATTSFSKTGFFDVNKTPSETGLLSETFRDFPGVERSLVPMSSFAASGPDAREFTKPYNSYLEPESPFSVLRGLCGKVMLFGVGYTKCTLYHLAEEREKVPYNGYKLFEGTIVDHHGKAKQGGQRYYVRKIPGYPEKDPTRVAMEFENAGNVRTANLGRGSIRVFDATHFDDYCTKRLVRNPKLFIRPQTMRVPK